MRLFPTHVARSVVCVLGTRVSRAKTDEPTDGNDMGTDSRCAEGTFY